MATSLEDLASRGYVTDEWARWQQGECDTYAAALLQARPDLSLGVLGRTDEGGWEPSHFFAHDDVFAYDSAGRHPMPYLGVYGDNDVLETRQDPEYWGVPDNDSPEALAAALAHASRHGILTKKEN